MVRVNLYNLAVVTLLAAVGIFGLKWISTVVPVRGFRDFVGGI